MKWYINNCDEIDEYEDFKYYGDNYSEYINRIDISGTNINYIDDIAKYPNLETIIVNEDNNIDEIPDLSTAGNHLKNLEFNYAQSASETAKKESFTIKKISNLETIPEKLLENGFEMRLNICGIEEITPQSKAIIQEYPDVIYVPLPSAMNYNNEAECAKKYYNLAGLDQYGNSYS